MTTPALHPAMPEADVRKIRFNTRRSTNSAFGWVAACSACGKNFYTLPEQSRTAITGQTSLHRDQHRSGTVIVDRPCPERDVSA